MEIDVEGDFWPAAILWQNCERNALTKNRWSSIETVVLSNLVTYTYVASSSLNEVEFAESLNSGGAPLIQSGTDRPLGNECASHFREAHLFGFRIVSLVAPLVSKIPLSVTFLNASVRVPVVRVSQKTSQRKGRWSTSDREE